MKPPRIVGDLSQVKAYAFGFRSLWGWGELGFILVEGTAFLLVAAAYIYLMTQAPQWPLNSAPPDQHFGALFTFVMVASQIPNMWVMKEAGKRNAEDVKHGLVIMSLIGIVLLVIRAFEFPHLNTRWDGDAYGSIVWAIMVLHTLHLVTDLIDTIALAVTLYTHPITPERFSFAEDNASYWIFVMLSWLPLYALVYWAPVVWP